MERILYFDCFSGISGDMTLGALIDLGVDPEYLKKELLKLQVDGYHLHIQPTERCAISGIDVDVHLDAHRHGHQEQEHDHTHDHDHTHEHDHKHEHNHDHEHGHGHEHHHDNARNLYDIKKIIEDSALRPGAKKLALDIFTEIAIAEGKVHGKSLEEVHFHEVGAVDSIVDIVGAAICLDILQPDRICCSPIREGCGFVKCQHGLLPVPVPAVCEMLTGSSLTLATGTTEGELVTPTGFGILKVASQSCGPMPAMTVEKIGYGFGKRETGSLNALRIFMGTLEASPAHRDAVTVIETTLDDERGEILGYTMERLFEAGALDAYYTPIFMKKNRPAVQLTVLCENDRLDQMSSILFEETSTIGLRHRIMDRKVLPRREETALLQGNSLRVKVSGQGSQEKSKPEYEDCVSLARKLGLPLRTIYQMLSENHR